ncbi:uncharacterized protein [Physcomitrium patens]|nr:pollen-specific leucine-rich repeat extensin-like protein 2 [Physcomitrium patens]XP_024400837.1 pollen-specific leucine-rich repeat extensin-like protein 2 [Physcomitrium patens]XP_024400838.1 pollen-specific leucine-rich repeat extensin-like protein 2 [Physcomitrium patens]XP_024400839.1 pollen-specific leucine-rich repeat extensin-like protein 2 [Physcomitrium patens]XP_024400840.1 pollen-specific leucine-rich repeat extensin-like protein 2 [Physcomitrium patens]XP_024400841.1 pollen-spe|eukprot:XP_024400836.1 pollen-specific leucine-rich repeat extensin-like protein 2 [Physcomitrella patens]
MSKLDKLKLASKKSLSCFLPHSMADTTRVPFVESEPPDDVHRPIGIDTAPKEDAHKEANKGKAPDSKHDFSGNAQPAQENLGREMVICAVSPLKSKDPPKPIEEEEILEIKTPGFVRLFGTCDSCEDSDHSIRHEAHATSSDTSDDEYPSSPAHQPPHMTPVVHLRVPMKDDHDVRKVVAALQIKGVLDIACDLANQVVKVTGSADPDRLLKKVKRVKRKSKLIFYTNPLEVPPIPENFHSSPLPTSPPPRPSYAFHHPSYEERFRPPHSPIFTRESQGPYGPYGPSSHSSRPSGRPMHYEDESFYHPRNPPPNVRPPPPPVFYRDDSFYPEYIPSNLRAPCSPPHYSSSSFHRERSPPHSRHSTSPPRRRTYYHERSTPNFRPPSMHHPGGPPNYYGSHPWSHGVPYWMDARPPMPERMQRVYR